MQLVLWVNNDLTAFAGRPLLRAINALNGYSQSDNSQHVIFIDGKGDVHELYRNSNPAAQWVDNDLTVFATGTPAISRALGAYTQGDNSQHVIFTDESGHLHELYRNPNPAAQWVDNDLTAFARGTPATVIAALSELVVYSQEDNSQHIIFIDANSNIHELYRNRDPAAQWVDNDLTFFARGSSPVISSALAGYSQSDGSQHINFLDNNGHIHELYRSPDPAAQWGDNDLTAFARATPAILFSALAGYSQSDNSQHVNFIDENGHAHELYRSSDPAAQWVDNDLTRFSGGTPAEVGSALAGYSQSDNSQHINFISGNGHVHELYRDPDPAAQWVDNDVTAQDGGNPAGIVRMLDAYLQSNNSQHINFISTDEHVHELYSTPCGPWPVFRHDWRRGGRSTIDTRATTGKTKWTFPTGLNVASSPVIGADGTIYFASQDGNLYAVDPNSNLKWRSRIATLGDPFQQGAPAIGPDGTIYFASANDQVTAGNLFAVNPGDGSVKWSFPTGGGGNVSSPAIGANGTIYFGSGDNNLCAVNPDGGEKWKFLTNASVASSPAIGADGTIYVGSGDGNLYAVTDGGQSSVTQSWAFRIGSAVESSPAIGADGTIYVGSDDGHLYAVTPNGTLKWQSLPAGLGTAVKSSPAIGIDGTVYVGSGDGGLYAVNPDGSQKWSVGTGSVVDSSPAIGADGAIYVGSDDGHLYALVDGGQNVVTLKWMLTTAGSVESSPAIGSDGTIYVNSDDGHLYAVN